jgi:hypothetical protein
MSSIVPLSRSPYRAPASGPQASGQGRDLKPHADGAAGESERVKVLAKRTLDRERPVAGCVAWAHDDGDEQTRWLVMAAGHARRQARLTGPDASKRRGDRAAALRGRERSDKRGELASERAIEEAERRGGRRIRHDAARSAAHAGGHRSVGATRKAHPGGEGRASSS